MATRTKKTKKDQDKKSHQSIFKSDTFKFIFGAILIILGLYIFSSFCFFFIHGGQDQDIVLAQNASTVELNNYIQESLSNNPVSNESGKGGASLSQFLINDSFGISALFIPIFLIFFGANFMNLTHISKFKSFATCTFLMIWGSVALHFSLEKVFQNSFISPGGKHGQLATEWLVENIGFVGVILLLFLTIIIFIVCVNPGSKEFIRNLIIRWKEKINQRRLMRKEKALTNQDTSEGSIPEPVAMAESKADTEDKTADMDTDNSDWTNISGNSGQKNTDSTQEESAVVMEEAADDTEKTTSKPNRRTQKSNEQPQADNDQVSFSAKVGNAEETVKKLQPYNPRLDLSRYKFPNLDLVNRSNMQGPTIDNEEQAANKERIITTLRNFDIEITHIDATVGPTITLYEITPAPGVRIAKIRNLEDDICMTLAATGIRIIAPIPGKGTIGIEVPNRKPQTVSIYEMLCSKKFAESTYELPVAIGKTITNEVYMFDLAKMPHLLVAGATGQGKSVGLNVILTSLLYKKHPAELKIVLVDPKMVEFSIYAPLEKHFLAKIPDEKDSIITDVNKVVRTLKSLCTLMDSRYELLKDANVREIKEYNKLFNSRMLNPEKGHHYMPYIVVVIDEYGDLIMTAGKEIEIPIARIAQKARAVGIHMIIATQRPSANIITGMIKTNFPARIAFKVSQMIDSRTIIDRTGAQRLVGRGDMLMLASNGETERIQCAFVDTPEVNNICAYIHDQQGYPEAYALPDVEEGTDDAGGYSGDLDAQSFDALFKEAAYLVIQSGQGSTSNIQRRFQVGFNRAGRIMDQLEKAGIVGPAEGSKPRQVLCSSDIELEAIFERLGII